MELLPNHIPASALLPHWAPSAAACCLQDLSVIDGDWQRLPEELLRLPLTRLHLRYADFADGEGELCPHLWHYCGGMCMCVLHAVCACCGAVEYNCAHIHALSSCLSADKPACASGVCVPVQDAGCPQMLAGWRAPCETSPCPAARSRAPREGQYQASSQTSGSAATCCHLPA